MFSLSEKKEKKALSLGISPSDKICAAISSAVVAVVTSSARGRTRKQMDRAEAMGKIQGSE